MNYRGINIAYIEDNGIERTNKDGTTVICNGYFCTIETENGDDYIDYFCAAVGYEIKNNSEEEIEDFIRGYVDSSYEQLTDRLNFFETSQNVDSEEADELEL